ncbi:hypothetical protein ACQKOF_07570 [Lysinibacillus sp. NPDC093190]|uniref:hypothetical protein n=1 Tax=Lysinibacillus sp. NPDC093190 TaxID=3390575 RepID=UPI003D017830
MKNNIIKNIIGLICFTLIFSIISPSLAKASEPQGLQINDSFSQEVINEQEIVNETDGINQDLGGPRINLEDEIQIEPRIAPLIPLLAGVAIRSGISFIARTSTGAVVKVSEHAAKRAVERKITGKMIDDALTNGTKYVDLLSGERVAWNENGNNVAVLLNKNSDEIDTVYDEDGKKLKWWKSSWKYVGNFKK